MGNVIFKQLNSNSNSTNPHVTIIDNKPAHSQHNSNNNNNMQMNNNTNNSNINSKNNSNININSSNNKINDINPIPHSTLTIEQMFLRSSEQ